jgi:hypothetical protein
MSPISTATASATSSSIEMAENLKTVLEHETLTTTEVNGLVDNIPHISDPELDLEAQQLPTSSTTEGSISISIPNLQDLTGSDVLSKYGTLIPNRVFVGGISTHTTEAELALLFSKYGSVKGTKIIMDRAGISKGYGFVTFETEEEARRLFTAMNNRVMKKYLF